MPGDEALLMSPVDFLLANSATAIGGVVTHYSVKARDYSMQPTFDLTKMEALVTPHTILSAVHRVFVSCVS